MLFWGPRASKGLMEREWTNDGIGFTLGLQVAEIARKEEAHPAVEIQRFAELEVALVIPEEIGQLLPERVTLDYDGEEMVVT